MTRYFFHAESDCAFTTDGEDGGDECDELTKAEYERLCGFLARGEVPDVLCPDMIPPSLPARK